MVPNSVSVIPVFLAEANRQLAAAEAAAERDRVDVDREQCMTQALAMMEQITAYRTEMVQALVAKERARRTVFNKWLPRCFQFSLEEHPVRRKLTKAIVGVYEEHSALAGSCKRLLQACGSTEPTVSVVRRDWNRLQAQIR